MLKIQGYFNKKIAELFNVSEETIRKEVRNNNLKKQNKVRPENKGLSKHPMYSIASNIRSIKNGKSWKEV